MRLSAGLEELLPFGDSFPIAGELVATLLIVVLSAIAYWIVKAAGRRYVRRGESKGPEAAARAATLWIVLRRLVLLVIVFLAVLFVFLAWGWSIAPFLGVGTVLAAAIGFGAQDVVKDFLSGFFILMEDQFHVGDVVTLEGSTGTVTTGTVEDIQLRVTLLRDLEGNEHFVPNGQIVVTSNFTSKYAQPLLEVGVAYETDIDRALEVLGDEMRRLAADPDFSGIISDEPEVLGVVELGDSSIKLRARLTTVADQRWAVQREAMKRIKKRFDAEGITIPFPQVTINQKT
ncbi:MAG: mechanosensitive ion channel family protein [Acidimicrobiia bacterium]|jgi:small conductance mechanosensitive channel